MKGKTKMEGVVRASPTAACINGRSPDARTVRARSSLLAVLITFIIFLFIFFYITFIIFSEKEVA